MKIIIGDDEKLARQRLKSLLKELKVNLSSVTEASTGQEVLLKWREVQADVIFLDIRMPGGDGLSVAEELIKMQAPVAIIFTTAYDEYALPAFDVNAVDYLLKPIRKERLEKALAKAEVLNQDRLDSIGRLLPQEGVRTHICVQVKGGLHLVPLTEILYFQAEQKYVVIKTQVQEYLCDESLKSLEQEFSDFFLRIHRNALVAKKRMAELKKQPEGKLLLTVTGSDKTLEVSRRMAASVRGCLKGNNK